MAGTLEIPTIGSPNSTQDPKIKSSLETLNNRLNSENLLGNTLRWQTAKVIATEESRENVAFGTLTTADEIKSVVLPENGLLVLGYTALVKSPGGGGAGKVAFFLGANQLKLANAAGAPAVQQAETTAAFSTIVSASNGMEQSVGTSFVTTGQALSGSVVGQGGFCTVFAAAGTYNISVQFKASTGAVTAKERKLWVGVLGV